MNEYRKAFQHEIWNSDDKLIVKFINEFEQKTKKDFQIYIFQFLQKYIHRDCHWTNGKGTFQIKNKMEFEDDPN